VNGIAALGCRLRGTPVTGCKMRHRLLLLLLAGLMAACSSRTRPGDTSPATILEVDNRGNLDMTIYVIAFSGARTRIGEVIAHTVEFLTIPSRLMDVGIVPLQFQADPVGSSARPITHSINVQRGDTVVMILPVRDAQR
jgi:hypothetical protein